MTHKWLHHYVSISIPFFVCPHLYFIKIKKAMFNASPNAVPQHSKQGLLTQAKELAMVSAYSQHPHNYTNTTRWSMQIGLFGRRYIQKWDASHHSAVMKNSRCVFVPKGQTLTSAATLACLHYLRLEWSWFSSVPHKYFTHPLPE